MTLVIPGVSVAPKLLRAAPTGFEPAISALTGPHVSRYTTGPVVKRPIVYHALSSPSSNWCELRGGQFFANFP